MSGKMRLLLVMLFFGIGLVMLPRSVVYAQNVGGGGTTASNAQMYLNLLTPNAFTISTVAVNHRQKMNTTGLNNTLLGKQFKTAGKSLQAVKAIDSPRIDGDLSEWANVPYVTLNASTADYHAGKEPYPSTTDLSMNVFSAWNDSFVWFAFAVTDDVIVEDSTSLWKDDEIELGIDGLNDHEAHWFEDDHQYLFTANGRDSDFGQRTPTAITFAVRRVLGGWNVEVRIPRSELGFASTPLLVNQIIGFNLGLHDDDDGGDYDTHLIWRGNSTNNSQDYGKLILSGLTYAFQATPTPEPTVIPTVTPTPTPTSMPAPDNDDIDRATYISVSAASFASTYTEKTSGATTAADDPNLECVSGQRYHSVWYRITPLVNSRLTIDTFGSQYDTVLAVWTGKRGALHSVGCNDDSDGQSQSRLAVDVRAGTVYYIEIVGFSVESYGNLTFNVYSVPSVSTATPTPTAMFTPTPTNTPALQFIPWLPVRHFVCGAYEPNNNRYQNPWGPLLTGYSYNAMLCAKDPEDNYYFDTTTTDNVQISLQLPSKLVSHTAIWLYAQSDLNKTVCGTGPVTVADYSKTCHITHTGRYIINIYTDGVVDNVHPYILRMTYR